MSESTDPGKAAHVPEKMRGPNRGDLQTVLKKIDLSETPTPWIKTQTGAGEIEDKSREK